MKKENSWFMISGKIPNIKIPGGEVRFLEDLPLKLIKKYSKKGDKVFDPFAGFGTSLIAAEKLGRIPYGIEFEKKRYEFIRNKIRQKANIIHGSALKISSYKLPMFDLSITSPPYMRSFDKENPFSNYHKKGNYKAYLRDIVKIYKQVKKQMKPNAIVLVEISNTFDEVSPMTPLAWDVAKELSKIFFLERDLICISKDESPAQGTDHSYVLVFRNKNPNSSRLRSISDF